MPRSKRIPNKVKFLLDENIDVRINNFLQEQGFECQTVKKGLKDKDVFRQVKSNGLVLITLDHDFANTDLYPPDKTCSIIVLRVHPPTYQNKVSIIDDLLSSFKPGDMFGKTIIATIQGLEIEETK